MGHLEMFMSNIFFNYSSMLENAETRGSVRKSSISYST